MVKGCGGVTAQGCRTCVQRVHGVCTGTSARQHDDSSNIVCGVGQITCMRCGASCEQEVMVRSIRLHCEMTARCLLWLAHEGHRSQVRNTQLRRSWKSDTTYLPRRCMGLMAAAATDPAPSMECRTPSGRLPTRGPGAPASHCVVVWPWLLRGEALRRGDLAGECLGDSLDSAVRTSFEGLPLRLRPPTSSARSGESYRPRRLTTGSSAPPADVYCVLLYC